MTELRAIDGSKARKAKTMAASRILQCKCGSRQVRDEYVGRVVEGNGRTVLKGTRITVCGVCGKTVE